MKINTVNHIAINTMHIEESIKFYTEVLNFKLKEKIDIGDCVLVYIEVNKDTSIELFDLKGACIDRTPTDEDRGLRHIAFAVEDIAAWNEHLKSKGATFKLDLCEFTPVKKNIILIEDPDKVVIELCEDI